MAISTKDLIQALSSVKELRAADKKTYSSIRIGDHFISYRRDGKSEEQKLRLSYIKEICNEYDIIGQATCKSVLMGKYGLKRQHFFSHAILKEAGLIDDNNVLVAKKQEEANDEKSSEIEKYKRFFKGLSMAFGEAHIASPYLGKPIAQLDLHLVEDYKAMKFIKSAVVTMRSTAASLRGQNFKKDKHIHQKIPGVLKGHPKMGSRIVVFDDYRDFNPAMKIVLRGEAGGPYYAYYQEQLRNPEVYRKSMESLQLSGMGNYPIDFDMFIDFLRNGGNGKNKNVEPKLNFPFIGGALAQKAYENALYMMANQSKFNHDLMACLRVPVMFLEENQNKAFSDMSIKEISDGIKAYIKEFYDEEL